VNAFLVVVNIILAIAALVTVRFAWQAARSSAEAAALAKESISYVADTAKAAEQTAAESAVTAGLTKEVAANLEATLETARGTLKTAHESREADDRERRLKRLLDIAEISERIFWVSAEAEGYGSERLPEQNVLEQLIAGSGMDLPACRQLGQAHAVNRMQPARNAVREAEMRIGELIRERA
jgi:hypothetical protein